MLHAEGKSLRAIAREVGVSHQTVANDLRDAAKLSNLAVKKRPRRGPEFDTGFDTATVVSFQRRKP
jgi:IS30 family transposase